MELKRYVLMNNGKILDLRKIGFTKYISIEEMVKNYGKVKSTSDNILDWVEVGDLVGYKITPNTMLEIAGIKEEVAMVTILKTSRPNCFGTNNGDVRHTEILSIYKRQPNGDYKRYEVK